MAVSRKRILQAYVTPGHPIAFSSPQAVYRHFKKKIKLSVIKDILRDTDAYTLHRETRRPKQFNPFYIIHRRQQVQADLINIARLSTFNGGIQHLLVLIDAFSRKMWVYPLKVKSGPVTCRALRQWLNSLRKKPRIFYCDRGTEFTNARVRTLMHDHDVDLQFTMGNGKAPIVERVNKTLQILIYKYLSENETGCYIDTLNKLVETYNKRPHRSLKNMSPNEGDKVKNEIYVRGLQMQRFAKIKRRKPKHKVGNIVRVQTKPGKLGDSTRAYAEQAHGEYYQIMRISQRMPLPMYYLKSLNTREIIQEGFYEYELTKVGTDVFKVEKILKQRGRGKNKQYYVRWLFFGPDHDQWIKASEVTKRFRL